MPEPAGSRPAPAGTTVRTAEGGAPDPAVDAMPLRSTPVARVPPAALRGIALALVLAGVAGATLEWSWRRQGVAPSVRDTPTLWAVQRARASGRPLPVPFTEDEKRPGRLVLLGASRMHLGFDVDLCRRRLPNRSVYQLALPGTPPWAALRDLAADPLFPPAPRGDPTVVLVSVSMNHFTTGQLRAGASYPDRARDGVSRREAVETAISASVQRSFSAMAPDVGPEAILARLRQGRGLVPKLRRTMRADRAAWLVEAAPDSEFLRKQAVLVEGLRNFPDDPADRAAAVSAVAADIARLRGRGVTVVLLSFPASEDLADAERARFPRSAADGWDRLVEELNPDAAVHHEDLPSAGTFHCPDWSHLDAASATRFTGEVLNELERRGVLTGVR